MQTRQTSFLRQFFQPNSALCNQPAFSAFFFFFGIKYSVPKVGRLKEKRLYGFDIGLFLLLFLCIRRPYGEYSNSPPGVKVATALAVGQFSDRRNSKIPALHPGCFDARLELLKGRLFWALRNAFEFPLRGLFFVLKDTLCAVFIGE